MDHEFTWKPGYSSSANRMYLLAIAFCAVGGALPDTAAVCRADLIVNGSFEAPSGWGLGIEGFMPPNWNITSSTPDLYSSDASFGLPPNSGGHFTGVTAFDGLGWVAGNSNNLNNEAFGQQLQMTLVPGIQYNLSGYLFQAKSISFNNPGGYDILLNSSNTKPNAIYLGSFAPTTGQNSWEFRTLTFTAPANADSLPWIIFQPYQFTAFTPTYPGLDNVSLTSGIPEPTGGAAIIATLGVAGIVWRRRRSCRTTAGLPASQKNWGRPPLVQAK